jgi:uncharacterized protein (DUF433 family)
MGQDNQAQISLAEWTFLQLEIKLRYHFSMFDWSCCAAVERNPGRICGAWAFKGTRVPVKALFENLEDGATVDDFLDWFPGVTREQIQAVLECAQRSLIEV